MLFMSAALPQTKRFVATLAGVVVLAGLLFLLNQRAPKESETDTIVYDIQRTLDMESIANVIEAYYPTVSALPPTLAVLSSSTGISIPVDPVGAPYGYEMRGQSSYRLCATFDQASESTLERPNWGHPSGRHCFEFDALAPASTGGATVIMPAGGPPSETL